MSFWAGWLAGVVGTLLGFGVLRFRRRTRCDQCGQQIGRADLRFCSVECFDAYRTIKRLIHETQEVEP